MFIHFCTLFLIKNTRRKHSEDYYGEVDLKNLKKLGL